MSDPRADAPPPEGPPARHLNGSSRGGPYRFGFSTGSVAPDALRVPSERLALLLAALAGVLYFLGFAGFEIVPLAFVSLTPLLLALRGRTGWRAFRLGWITGTVLGAGGFYWIAGMLKTFSGFPLPLCVVFALLLWAAQGLQFAVFAWFVARADTRGIPRLLSAPAALAAVELCFPVLFPWYTSNSLHGIPLLIQTADLGGPMLLSAVLALGHAALDDVLARGASTVTPWSRRLRPLVYPLAFWAFALPYGAWRMHQTDAATGRTLRVGIVQQNLGLQEKRTDPRLALHRHLEASRALEDRGVDLLFWSESALAFLIPEDLENIRDYVPTWDLRTPVMFGALSVRGRAPGERLYNTAFVTDAQGDLRGRYDKMYLLAFGEYLPGGETFPAFYRWSPNSGHFSPGTTMRALPIPGGTVMPLICYEDILPRFVRGFQRRADANLLAVILNDAWFGDTAEPWIHNALAQFRAVELRRDLVRAANSGVSSVIDANGRMVAHGGTFRREDVVATVRLRTGHTVYYHLGDWCAWLGVALCAYTLVPRRRRSPAAPTDAPAAV